jgi:hypothetical protein
LSFQKPKRPERLLVERFIGVHLAPAVSTFSISVVSRCARFIVGPLEKSFPPGPRRVTIPSTTYAQPFLEGSVMPFFTELTDITDPAKYVNELKAAFRSPNGKKFAYFNNHPKCPKRPHVLLVDYEGGIAKMLGGTPKAEGKVFITDKEEISFDTTKGAMKIRPLKKYIETFYKTRPILVPTTEPEEESPAKSSDTTNTAKPPTQVPSSPPLSQPQSQAPSQDTSPKLEPRPSTSPPQRPPPPTPQTKPKGPSAPTLSAYMNATTQWKSAKAAAEDGVFKLKKAILEACDPELKDLVKVKVNSVNSILAPLDDVIVKKIDEARSDSDDERRAGREKAIGKLATDRLQALRQHPLAGVADSNPFGNFTIRAPMEEFFTKIASTFGI